MPGLLERVNEDLISNLSHEDQAEFLALSTKVLAEQQKKKARKHHLAFMQYCWRKAGDDPLIVGVHTRKICERIDQAMEDFRHGKSSFIRIAVHHRSGKSDIVSRFLPAHFIGEFPDREVIQTSYNVEKSLELASDGYDTFLSEKYKELYPGMGTVTAAIRDWKITKDGAKTGGRVYASSLFSGLTGSGYHLGIVDDYVSGREAAESPSTRRGIWNSFTNDFMTRRAPVSITIILATWWHWDDLHGRIKRKNEVGGEEYDANFPVFEVVKFPARAIDSPFGSEYDGEFLFERRYNAQWYREQYAELGVYSGPAVMDCNPIRKGGSILSVEKITTHPNLDEFPKGLRWYRVWDFAHTEKQRTGDDPDYTGGTLLAFRYVGRNFELKTVRYEIWVRDYVQFRELAPKRDQKIIDVTRDDGQDVQVLVEDSLDSTDGAQYLKARLLGLRVVHLVPCVGDKVVRCTPIEPYFEGGLVHIVRAAWNRIWLDALERFDGSGSSHDEPVDNLTCAYMHVTSPSRGYSRLTVTEK